MNLKSIWSALEESFGVLDEWVDPAFMKFVQEMNVPPSWGMWGPAIILFPSESFSSSDYMKIFPYGRVQVIDERFSTAVKQGFLTLSDDGYHATDQGMSINQQGLQALTDAIAQIAPIHLADFQRLIDYLIRLSDSLSNAPEPPSKFCFEHYKNYKRTFSSDAPLSRLFAHYFKELDFYRMDSHMAAWRIHNIEGNRWEVFSEVWGGKNNTLDRIFEERSYRGITRKEYASILQELVERGWIHQNGETYQSTSEGNRIREEAEALTDRYFFASWSCLSEPELEDLINLAIQLRDGLSRLKEQLLH